VRSNTPLKRLKGTGHDSNAAAMVLLFCCGYAFGYRTGLSPWISGLFMIVFAGALVGVAIALGG
jgi:hypothetical protein